MFGACALGRFGPSCALVSRLPNHFILLAGARRRVDQKLKSLLDFAAPAAKVKCMLKHEAEAADRVFHALADANRRAVIERLTRGPATVSELAAQLGVTVAATVQHLRVLQDSELVRSEKAGRVRTCQIDPAGLRNAEAWLQRQRTAWEHRLDRLGAVLDDQTKESGS